MIKIKGEPRPLDEDRKRPKPHVHKVRTAIPKMAEASGLIADPFEECVTCYTIL